ncbi:hypothetical protein S7711_11493 [Stachybotrys chartarum IBT 7711]|uniref:Chromo domain-containing protein n=1 Tax=Stachybotrys chartarum (strain CBS 109288 / IBT 7711) TaxID=1280523 RepID=A0A084AXL9_STACB|nr:hypothetical protein S7711_11493 [Stachybotrys chartarum IBT 7711]
MDREELFKRVDSGKAEIPGSLQQNPTLNGNGSDYNQEHQDEIVSSDDDELPTIEQIFKEATQRRMRNEGQQDNETPSVNQPVKRGREEDNQSVSEKATPVTKRRKDDKPQWQNHDTLSRLGAEITPLARYSQILDDQAMNPPLLSCFNGRREVTNKSKKHLKPARNTQASKNLQPETEKGDTYEVACLLARYRHEFFLEWKLDGSRGWVKSSDILDKAMIEDFIKEYSGFDEGFDLIQERLYKRRTKYLLHARGHSSKEDFWVSESLISPKRLAKIKKSGLDSDKSSA